MCSDVRINGQLLETDDEEKAYKLLFDRYYKTVFDYVSKMMWDYPDPIIDAYDITGETFTKAFDAFKNGKEIQDPETLSGWLITIARNLTIDNIRKSERRARYLLIQPLDDRSVRENDLPVASMIAEAEAEQTEASRYLTVQLFRLLPELDRKIVSLRLDGLSPKEIAEAIGSTPGAVQKRWERLIAWLSPVAVHLEALVECLPEERDRWIMERYLDGQPLSDIAKAIGISQSAIERTVKRVRAAWKKAAKENPTDPVSAMAKKKR